MFQTLLDKYSHKFIDYRDITTLSCIGKGGTGEVYKMLYNNKPIIGKCFHMENNYEYSEDLVDDVMHELSIYQELDNTKYCCEWIGISYLESKNKNMFILLLKDYNVIGDLFDFINNDKYWSKLYKNEVTKEIKNREYYYSYKNKHWIYCLDRSTKINITKQLCMAIQELQNKNIVHCDLKTNNILYNSDNNRLVIIDFGASHKLTKEYNIISKDRGTIGYSCEKLNSGYCSKKSDIFSLAVCITEVWCGGIWQEGKTYKECRLELLKSLRCLSKKEPELEKILRNCIHLNNEKRPTIKTVIKKINQIL